MPELTAPFVFKNDEKRIVYGPVLIPDEPDSDNDVVTADQIENVAHKFVEEYGNIDLMHSLNNVGNLVESYILPVDLEINKNLTVPKGSWMMGVRVTCDNAWKAVKDNKLGGFSIMAMKKASMKSAEKDNKSKRVTLADLGDDWIVNAVSLVDEPAVPKAKWIAIKSKDNDNSNIDIDSDIVKKAVTGSLEHRRRLVSQALEKTFGGYERNPYVHSTLHDSVIFRIQDHEGDRRTFKVGYNIMDNGIVEFTEQPQEVLIEETAVPIQAQNMIGSTSSTKKEDTESTPEQSEGFMSKFIQRLGFGNKPDKKAKNDIPSDDLKKFHQAKQVIDDLLAIGETKRSSEQTKEGAGKMKEKDVQKMIDEKLEPIESKIDDVLKAMKNDVKEDDKQDETKENNKEDDEQQGKSEEGGDSSEKGKDYKELYQGALKQLEKAKRIPFSQRIAGQDNMKKSKEHEKPDRNAFGFKSE